MGSRTHRPNRQRQRGAALIYLLFIISFVGVVLPVVLLTLTQGQLHLVQYEQKQRHDYLSEGALEVALYTMEQYEDADAEKSGIYYFIVDELSAIPPEQPFMSVAIDGEAIPVAGKIEQIEPDRLTVRIFDASNPGIYRLLSVPVPPEDEEEIPDFEDGQPVEDIEWGYLYAEYLDGRLVEICSVSTCAQYISQHGGIEVEDGRLILNADINVRYVPGYQTITFSGTHGVFLTGDINTAANQAIEIFSDYGDIYIGNGADIVSSNELTVKAPNGHVVIEDGALRSSSWTDIDIDAGKYLKLKGVTLTASRDVHLSAGDIYIQDAILRSSSNGTVEVTGHQSVTLENAQLESTNHVRVTSGGSMKITASTLRSASNRPIELISGGNIIVDGSQLYSSRDVLLQSNGNISAKGATVQSVAWNDIVFEAYEQLNIEQAVLNSSRYIYARFTSAVASMYVADAVIRAAANNNNTVQVNQAGVQVFGRPASGCINNNGTLICP